MLEIGSGAGNLTIRLAAMGFEVSGVDISPTAISWAKKRAAENSATADFLLGNVVTLDLFESDVFDVVLDGLCLHCIIGADRDRCLSNVYRVLRPGGWFLIFTGCMNTGDERPEGYDSNTHIVSGEHLPAPRFFAPPNLLVEEVAMAGFEVVDQHIENFDSKSSMLTIQARKV